MDVTDAQSAEAYIRAWNGRIRPGIAKEALRGLVMRASIMDGSPSRYSKADREDARAAMTVIRRHLDSFH